MERRSNISRSPSSADSRSRSRGDVHKRHSKKKRHETSKHRSRRSDSPPKRKTEHNSRRRSTSPEVLESDQDIRRRDQQRERYRSSNVDQEKSPRRRVSRSDSEFSSEDERIPHTSRKHKSSEGSNRKSNRKDRSSDSNTSQSDSDSSENEKWITDRLKHLQEDKLKKGEEKKNHKLLMKMMETPEEKRLRRLLKKEAKERKRKERMGWDKDYMHYTNTDNPFGDANLLETFVWSKKMEKNGLGKVSHEEIELQNKLKQEENRVELEKVKKRRLEREQERAQREDEMQRMQREKEAAQFKEWEKQEDTFHLQQALLRSKIRIEDGRAKPIDLLAKYISAEDEDLAVEMHEPYTYLNGLAIRDLEDLLEDIKVYMELEKGKNLDYWNDITIIVEEELYKLRKADPANKERYGDRREGINNSVENSVIATFKGKSYSQLLGMHDQIQKRINCREEGTDIGYWESILARLKAQIARAKLRERHQDNLRRKLFQLKQEQGVDYEPVSNPESQPDNRKTTLSDPSLNLPHSSSSLPSDIPDIKPKLPIENVPVTENADTTDEENEAVLTENDLQELSIEEYNSGRYTPQLIPFERIEPATILIDPFEDLQRLEFTRRQLIGTGSVLNPTMSSAEKAMEIEARKGMTDDEAVFSVEAQLDHKVYLWSDKYRPRKPRYFNRVHTGFEWNKYNQTHYDMDNPPPKIVQGYKFNIFFPDLIDRSITPEYALTACPDNRDFGILRFHAGPPYEDIAFKIVNREWEYSYKRGFRCQFHNNIFQLWFHFKRYRYRR